MDWRRAMEAERAALTRLVALIFALADLADRASARSPLIRAFVLWILRPAAAAAWTLADAAPEVLPSRASAGGTSQADAAHLALSLRRLASLLMDEVDLTLAAFTSDDEDALECFRSAALSRFFDASAFAALAPREPRMALYADTS